MNIKQGELCPLCNGRKSIWGSCCSGYMCGCMGMPSDGIECHLCSHTGMLIKNIEPEEIASIEADIKNQEETQQWFEETYPEYFKQPE